MHARVREKASTRTQPFARRTLSLTRALQLSVWRIGASRSTNVRFLSAASKHRTSSAHTRDCTSPSLTHRHTHTHTQYTCKHIHSHVKHSTKHVQAPFGRAQNPVSAHRSRHAQHMHTRTPLNTRRVAQQKIKKVVTLGKAIGVFPHIFFYYLGTPDNYPNNCSPPIELATCKYLSI